MTTNQKPGMSMVLVLGVLLALAAGTTVYVSQKHDSAKTKEVAKVATTVSPTTKAKATDEPAASATVAPAPAATVKPTVDASAETKAVDEAITNTTTNDFSDDSLNDKSLGF